MFILKIIVYFILYQEVAIIEKTNREKYLLHFAT